MKNTKIRRHKNIPLYGSKNVRLLGSMIKNGPALLQLREAIENVEGWAESHDIRPMTALKLYRVVETLNPGNTDERVAQDLHKSG